MPRYDKPLKDALPEIRADAQRMRWGYELLYDATAPTTSRPDTPLVSWRERRPGERKLSSWDRKRMGLE